MSNMQSLFAMCPKVAWEVFLESEKDDAAALGVSLSSLCALYDKFENSLRLFEELEQRRVTIDNARKQLIADYSLDSEIVRDNDTIEVKIIKEKVRSARKEMDKLIRYRTIPVEAASLAIASSCEAMRSIIKILKNGISFSNLVDINLLEEAINIITLGGNDVQCFRNKVAHYGALYENGKRMRKSALREDIEGQDMILNAAGNFVDFSIGSKFSVTWNGEIYSLSLNEETLSRLYGGLERFFCAFHQWNVAVATASIERAERRAHKS